MPFFLIYINDLPLHFDHCSSDLYADDVTVHTHDSNIKIIVYSIIHDFDNAVAWSKPNKMKVHFSKTTCKLVGTRPRIRMSRKLNIQLENTCIKMYPNKNFLESLSMRI